jgi:hypothetical protein
MRNTDLVDPLLHGKLARFPETQDFRNVYLTWSETELF